MVHALPGLLMGEPSTSAATYVLAPQSSGSHDEVCLEAHLDPTDDASQPTPGGAPGPIVGPPNDLHPTPGLDRVGRIA